MDTFNTLQSFKHGKLYSLPALGKALVDRLPTEGAPLPEVLRSCLQELTERGGAQLDWVKGLLPDEVLDTPALHAVIRHEGDGRISVTSEHVDLPVLGWDRTPGGLALVPPELLYVPIEDGGLFVLPDLPPDLRQLLRTEDHKRDDQDNNDGGGAEKTEEYHDRLCAGIISCPSPGHQESARPS